MNMATFLFSADFPPIHMMGLPRCRAA
jgi:hypothetical protein